MNVIETLKKEEGFRGDVYKDHLGFDTVGYGTKMPITEEEAEMLLVHRLSLMEDEFHRAWDRYPSGVTDSTAKALKLLLYQMGCPRLLRFKKMLYALETGNHLRARAELLDSKFARQTPDRAYRVADLIR